jgi:UDP-N-acetylmuramyl pentapeptide phosphotransferase/UDP-N-acetylglucosamine-1-phosphate transferase
MADEVGAWHVLGLLGLGVLFLSLIVTSGLIVLLAPLFLRFALAVPTGRSSHRAVTPQWGGIAVIGTTVVITTLVLLTSAQFGGAMSGRTYPILVATLLLAIVGVIDDIWNLSAAPKLIAQAVALVLVMVALPADLRLMPGLPLWFEHGLLFVGGLWFINLVNFMDGIDWMMVAEVVPITAGVVLVGALGAVPPEGLVVALALNGAMLGFAPFNRPVARLFLGDMGSLPTGLLLIWLLFLVAGSGHVAAALLLPLYFVADASVTLLRRLRARERVWEAHRTHFYQRAGDKGFSTMEIIGRVFAVNCGLVALAAMSVLITSPVASLLAVALGGALVACVIVGFARGPS